MGMCGRALTHVPAPVTSTGDALPQGRGKTPPRPGRLSTTALGKLCGLPGAGFFWTWVLRPVTLFLINTPGRSRPHHGWGRPRAKQLQRRGDSMYARRQVGVAVLALVALALLLGGVGRPQAGPSPTPSTTTPHYRLVSLLANPSTSRGRSRQTARWAQTSTLHPSSRTTPSHSARVAHQTPSPLVGPANSLGSLMSPTRRSL